MADEMFSDEIYTLTDEDGNENQFELIGSRDVNGITYLALVPIDDNEDNEYVILRLEHDDNGEDILVTIDDDNEFERIADIFDNELFSEENYDIDDDEDDEEDEDDE